MRENARKHKYKCFSLLTYKTFLPPIVVATERSQLGPVQRQSVFVHISMWHSWLLSVAFIINTCVQAYLNKGNKCFSNRENWLVFTRKTGCWTSISIITINLIYAYRTFLYRIFFFLNFFLKILFWLFSFSRYGNIHALKWIFSLVCHISPVWGATVYAPLRAFEKVERHLWWITFNYQLYNSSLSRWCIMGVFLSICK